MPLPIKWDDWDEGMELGNFILSDVEFLSDFGVFKKGEKLHSIHIDYHKGIITEYDNNGDELRIQEMEYIPKG